MKKFILILIMVVGMAGVARAQSDGQYYNTTLGVSLGPEMSADLKLHFTPRSAVELMIGYNIPDRGVMLSAVYQYHFTLAQGFRLYIGAGVNLGALDLRSGSNGVFAFGVDPTVGFEYTFAKAPVVLALDYKPNINFTCQSQWQLAAFKIRFKI